jgi:hypothetical protein
MTTSTPDVAGSNGHVVRPDDPYAAFAAASAERLDAERATLQQLLDDELGAQREISDLLDASKLRTRRLERALAALTDEPKEPKPKPAPRASAAQSPSSTWMPSQKMLDRVLAAVVEAGGPITRTALSSQLHVSPDTARKSLHVLRERELVRIAGVTRGGGKTYAAMPEATAAIEGGSEHTDGA